MHAGGVSPSACRRVPAHPSPQQKTSKYDVKNEYALQLSRSHRCQLSLISKRHRTVSTAMMDVRYDTSSLRSGPGRLPMWRRPQHAALQPSGRLVVFILSNRQISSHLPDADVVIKFLMWRLSVGAQCMIWALQPTSQAALCPFLSFPMFYLPVV